jgi:hypothetical protein
MIAGLDIRTTPGAIVQETTPDTWRLQIPPGPAGVYRLAQLDDYTKLWRGKFRWHAPITLQFEARNPLASIPGTWGVGLWNDPFSLSLGLAGTTRRIPALPNTAWFFFASPPNCLSLRDDLPGAGSLAATFQSPVPQWPWLLGGAPGLPLMLLPATARLIRRVARRVIKQDAKTIHGAADAWRSYQITWLPDRVRFQVNQRKILNTRISPRGPLGLVLWIDNQYAAWPPSGKLAFGTLDTPDDAFIEIRRLRINSH